MNFKITDEQIVFTGSPFDEADTINEARDFAEKHFHDEIRQGKTLYFDDWNMDIGAIDYRVEY